MNQNKKAKHIITNIKNTIQPNTLCLAKRKRFNKIEKIYTIIDNTQATNKACVTIK